MTLTKQEAIDFAKYCLSKGYNPLLEPEDAEKFIQHWYKNIRGKVQDLSKSNNKYL